MVRDASFVEVRMRDFVHAANPGEHRDATLFVVVKISLRVPRGTHNREQSTMIPDATSPKPGFRPCKFAPHHLEGLKQTPQTPQTIYAIAMVRTV
jgi:hypothetical protein